MKIRPIDASAARVLCVLSLPVHFFFFYGLANDA